MKRINELFDVEEDFKILSLHSDSRYVGKDSIFFCVEGLSTDGHKYADDAVFQGAKCIVHSKPLKREYPGVLYIQVNDVLAELNRVANIFYDYPSYKMTVFGVTGTSGKTIVSLMIRDVLGHYIRMGYMGTNDSQFDNRIVHSPYTTPEPIYLHRTLNEMVKANVKGVSLEVSSYGLTLHRVDSIDFDVAIFTNLYPENLDFHGTLENLMRAYAKLFIRLDEKNTVILNADSVVFNHYLQTNEVIKAKIITYGIEHHADIMAHDIREFIDHTEFILLLDGHMFDVSVPILGGFNVPMVLALIAALKSMEMPLEQIIEALQYIKPIDGRMELLETNQPFDVLIDYCAYIHSYKNIFKFARKVKRGKGRIIAVFGPSGSRNDEREAEIARLANAYCDQVILTEQDGRIDNIQEACENMQKYITKPVSVIITNRRIAISQAIELACKDDIILILGKGHEQFMASSLSNIPYPGDKYVAKSAIDMIFRGGNEDEI